MTRTSESVETFAAFPFPERQRQLAAALVGDETALSWALGSCDLEASPASSRLGPALYLRARALGLEGSALAEWRRELAKHAAGQIELRASLSAVAAALGAAGIGWAPIKGVDTGCRVFDCPEERPTGDLDVLIPGERLAEARSALRHAGWEDRFSSKHSEAFLRDEGYNWQAVDAQGTLLELHYRLWGVMPAGAAAEVLERSAAAPELGATARRIGMADALVLAAVHTCLQRPPRPLLYFWEIHRLTATAGAVVEEAAKIARRWGLQLPVGLAAAASAALFPAGGAAGLAALMLGDLRTSERFVARRCRRRGVDAASLGWIYLSRLLAGRPTRGGWRSVIRRVWAHPAVVEQQTPPEWSWWARRALHALSSLRPRATQEKPLR